MKNNITVFQDQDELVLTIKVKSNSYQNSLIVKDALIESSLNSINKFQNVNNELMVLSSESENKNSIFPNNKVNTIIGLMFGLLICISVFLFKEQFEKKKKRGAT